MKNILKPSFTASHWVSPDQKPLPRRDPSPDIYTASTGIFRDLYASTWSKTGDVELQCCGRRASPALKH